MFKSFFFYGVRLRKKSIITFRIVCFSCVKQQNMPATDEIKSYHENQTENNQGPKRMAIN